MNNRPHDALAVALIAALALAGCNKKEEAAPIPPPVVQAPASIPASTPAPTGTVSIVSVDIGNGVAANAKLAVPAGAFDRKDTIHAVVSTATSDPAAKVPGKLGVKWTYQDGQVVNEETRNIDFTGSGTTDFQISKPDGWPAGKYKVEVSLDGNVVQSKDFEVK